MKNCILISACKNSKDDTKNTQTLKNDLIKNGMEYLECIGMYQGTSEFSFCVRINQWEDIETLRDLGNKFKQESILYVDDFSKRCLIYASGKVEQIGEMREVSKEEAYKNQGFTYCNKGYFVCK